MKKKNAPSKGKKKKDPEEDLTVQFRERRLRDIPIVNLNHPKPIPGYKATLPGAPGWWAKESPGA